MPDLPRITENTIRNLTDSGSFARGQSYYNNGYISSPRRQGMELQAKSLGSTAASYHVRVVFSQDGIVSTHCSCPIGAACKHVVALLLTWLRESDMFAEVEELTTLLAQREKDELIALIKRMVDLYPDLEDLLNLPVAGAASTGKIIDPDIIRRRVLNAMPDEYDDYGYGYYETSSNLYPTIQLGEDYLKEGDWRNAQVVYSTTAEAVLDSYDDFHDEEGDILSVVNDCVLGLGRSLALANDADGRLTILRSLFHVYAWDMDIGGYGVSDEVPSTILEQANADEKAQIAEWVREQIPTAENNDFSANWRRNALGGFLLDLEADTLDDEAFLRTCRETGRMHELVDRLLVLGRVDEAVSEVEQMDDTALLRTANLFRTHQRDELAQKLVVDRAKSSTGDRLIIWLKEFAEEQGDSESALQYTSSLFDLHPESKRYEDLKRIAEPTGQWQTMQAEILQRLEERENYLLLTKIYLLEGDIDQALRMLPQSRNTPRLGWYVGGNLSLEVAAAAATKRPEAAIRLYLEQAERLIGARDRKNYAAAARLLKEVKRIHESTNQIDAWHSLVQSIRDQYRNLPAMQDEFNRAGLD